MFKSLLVLESSWDSMSIHSKSVWPFISEFAKAYGIQAFFLPFSDKASLEHWVKRFHKAPVPGPKLLYVAAHGSRGRIGGLRNDIQSATVMKAIKSARSIRYVHFGSCAFGSRENLMDLQARAKHLQWVAGYEKDVDWVDSTLFDILFWNRIAVRGDSPKGRHFHNLVTDLVHQIPGLAEALGFRFSYRRGARIECPEFKSLRRRT